MSAQTSFVTVPSSTAGDAQTMAHLMQIVGSVYWATPYAVGDTQARGFQIDAFGRLQVIGGAADNAPVAGNPVLVSGVYNSGAQTYGNGDAATFQMDVNGILLTKDTGAIALLTSILTAVDQLEGYTDGLETLIGSSNTLATTLNGYTDGIETLIGTTNSTLTTLNTYVDGVEALIGTTNTTLATLNTYVDQLEGYVDGIEGLQTSTNTKLDSVIANSNKLTVLHSVYIDYSASNLPGNASNILQLVASTSAAIKKIQVFDTAGVPFELRTGATTGTAKAVFGPGVDNEFEIDIPTATRVGVRRLDAVGAITGGTISINFLG